MRNHTETAQIVQFSAVRPKVGKKIASRSEVVSNPQCEGGVTATCKNRRLRRERHIEWRRADAVREYWQVSLKMGGVISRVQHFEMPQGDLHPEFKPADHWTLGQLATLARPAMARLSHVALGLTVPRMSQDL